MRDLYGKSLSMREWQDLIDITYSGRSKDVLANVDRSRPAEFDAIFVGGGSAGRFGAAVMRSLGGRALVVDRWPFLGGSCPHQACVPHHLFSEAARELDQARALAGRLWYPKFDPDAASILELVELFRSQRSGPHAHMNWQSAEQLRIEYVLNAEARVVDAHTVDVAGQRFKARALVLATGSRATKLGVQGEDLPGVFDYASLVEDLDYEPRRVVVIGGSKVAVEYASFFHAVGRPTTVVCRGRILSSGSPGRMDDDLRDYIVSAMRDRGITLLEHSRVQRIVGKDRVSGAEVWTPDGVRFLEADFVLLGVGEVANTESFATALDLEYDSAGFVVADQRMQTNVSGVYAVGDLIGPPMEMFKSRRSGTTAARNIMGVPTTLDVRNFPDFLHTTYEVTWAGLGEREARERIGDVVTIQVPPPELAPHETPLPMSEGSMIYGFTMPERTGFQKCVVDARTRRVVGIHHAGHGAKSAFSYLHHLMTRPEGLTIDELACMNELYISADYFIGYARLRSSQANLTSM